MIAALLEADERTGRRWLSFPGPPPVETRQTLLAAGWRYNGGHRAWFSEDLEAPIPPEVTVGRGGACNYSATRAVRGEAILELLARTRDRVASQHVTLAACPGA
jgi:hypothetical protein